MNQPPVRQTPTPLQGTEPDATIEAVWEPEPPTRDARPLRPPKRGGSVTVTAQHYAGPLPHPEMLARYNEVHPGASEIIFSEFRSQGAHRRDIEGGTVRANNRHALLGQIGAFLILGGISGGGIFLIHEGKDIAGLTALAGAIVAGLWALHAAKNHKIDDLNDKKKKNSPNRAAR